MTNQIKLVKLLVAGAGSRIFAMTFVKKDGSVVSRRFQNGVSRFLIKGQSIDNKYYEAVKIRALRYPNLLNLWSLTDKDFRAVDAARVLEIKINGEVHKFEPQGLEL